MVSSLTGCVVRNVEVWECRMMEYKLQRGEQRRQRFTRAKTFGFFGGILIMGGLKNVHVFLLFSPAIAMTVRVAISVRLSEALSYCVLRGPIVLVNSDEAIAQKGLCQRFHLGHRPPSLNGETFVCFGLDLNARLHSLHNNSSITPYHGCFGHL